MKTGTIQQQINFKGTPKKIYDCIMQAELHSIISGDEVTMSLEINGRFDVFGGYCNGYNIELIDGEKIVQAWHFAEEGWPDDHYSICTFNFKASADGCILDFTQTDVPEHKVEDLTKGWHDYYWDPITEYLESEI